MIVLETWKTKYGKSVRIVERDKNGRFINNKSGRQILKKMK